MGEACAAPDTTTREEGREDDSALSILASAATHQHQVISSAVAPPPSCPVLASSLALPAPPLSPRRRPVPDAEKDPEYWERRRRNNEAAKRSREKRRMADAAMEARLLSLKHQNQALQSELEKMPERPPVIQATPGLVFPPLPPIDTRMGLESALLPPLLPQGPFAHLGLFPNPDFLHHLSSLSRTEGPLLMHGVRNLLSEHSAFEPPRKVPKLEPDSTHISDSKAQLRSKILEKQGVKSEESLSLKACLSNLSVSLQDTDSASQVSTDGSTTGSTSGQRSESDGGSSPGWSGRGSPHRPALGNAASIHNRPDGKRLTEAERYSERRRRNNEAAKRCRANRRMLYEYRFKRAEELEAENGRLKEEMASLGAELAKLKALLAQRGPTTA